MVDSNEKKKSMMLKSKVA